MSVHISNISDIKNQYSLQFTFEQGQIGLSEFKIVFRIDISYDI